MVLDGWMVGGWKVGNAGLRIAYSNQQNSMILDRWMDGWKPKPVKGLLTAINKIVWYWMDGWMDGS